MAGIAGAVKSLADSMDALKLRFCGSDDEVVQLFRARLEIDTTEEQVALATDPDTAVGDELTLKVLHLSADISLLPSDGGPPFGQAMIRTGTILAAVLACFPSTAAAASAMDGDDFADEAT